MLTISVVSHGQRDLVHNLLSDIALYCGQQAIEVIVTLNTPEALPFEASDYRFSLVVLENSTPLGFGENHNRAFARASGDYFCVVNPDIRLCSDPFIPMLTGFEDTTIGVVAPMVMGEEGQVEDSARRFPSPLKILCKALRGCRGADYPYGHEMVYPDWVGGMFMLFPYHVFKSLGGFDRRFFLYYEDVDICARLRLSGYEVALCPAARVIHIARRSSHRNPEYLKWHLASMLRFFCSRVYLKILWSNWKGMQ